MSALPPALVLLVHLHLLGYESRDGSNYNEDLFDQNSRGGGERIKTMETVSFFLVGKIEGTVPRAKKVLPTFPCAQPSDTLAFRNALTKYMESLKHAALHPGTSGSSLSSTGAPAWWWKDVIVRKSLLEECHGERFARLLLALSTHALLRRTHDSLLYPSEQDVDLAASEAISAYASALAFFKTSRATWEDNAGRLSRRQDELNELKRQLEDPARTFRPAKYDHLSTDKLLALRDARIQDLLQGSWSPEGGKSALYDLFQRLELGVSVNSDHDRTAHPPPSDARTDIDAVLRQPAAAVHPPPDLQSLPLAAALHPKRIRQLTKPIPLTADATSSALDAESGKTEGIPQLMSDRLVAEAKSSKNLSEALRRAEQSQIKLKAQLDIAEAAIPPRAGRDLGKGTDSKTTDVALKLWTPRKARLRGLRETAVVAPTAGPRNVQARVDAIRASLKASFPPRQNIQETSRKIPVPTQLPRAALC